MFGGSYNQVKTLIGQWNPKKYPNESGYQKDLLKFLREGLSKPAYLGMGDGGVSVKKEANKCLSDIAVGKDIGIELKKDLHRKKDIDRLKGQIHGYLQEYQYILVVLVGEPSEDAWYNLERELKSLGGGGFSMQNTTIEVIDKGHNKQQSKKEDGWGFI